VEGKTVTVAGTDILGDLVITLDKVRTNAAVTVIGNAASELEADAAVAQPNKAFKATLHADSRYNYQVKATVNGKEVTLIQNGNVFTIAAEDVEAGSIEFTVTKTLKTDDFQVFDANIRLEKISATENEISFAVDYEADAELLLNRKPSRISCNGTALEFTQNGNITCFHLPEKGTLTIGF
jgi:hypothetical protein